MRENSPPHKISLSLEDIIREDDDDVIFLADDHIDEDFDNNEDDGVEEDDECKSEDENESGGFELRVPERDDSILTFTCHTGGVFAGSLHPTLDLAATGAEDDHAFIWNTKTGEKVYSIENHRDTVIASRFSHDGKYFVSGDMSGFIQVFKLRDELTPHSEFHVGDLCWLTWHNASNVLLAGTESGDIHIWRIPSNDCKVLTGNGSKCECAELSFDGKKLYCGYGDGSLRLWDIKEGRVIVGVNAGNTNSHSEGVLSVSCDPSKSLYMSGSDDGKILFTNNQGIVSTLLPEGGPIESVAFCPDSETKLAASGSLRGQLAIWDVQYQTFRVKCDFGDNDDEGITTIKWLPEQTLVCGTINGNIYGFDGRSGVKKFELKGHAAEIYEIIFDKRQNILLAISEDKTAKLFNVNF